MTLTVEQMIVGGIVLAILLVIAIASVAIALVYVSRGRKLSTPLGSIDGSCECSMSSKISEMYTMLSALVETNTTQSSNIVLLCRVQRPIMNVLRFHSRALREVGANGSTEKAEQMIDRAEEMLNEGALSDTESAMELRKMLG